MKFKIAPNPWKASPNLLEKSVGIAAVNALSQLIMDHEPDRYRFSDTDLLSLLPFGEQRLKVGMVGNIGPFVPFLIKHASCLTIVDDNPLFFPGFQENGYTISRNIADLADVDVLIITGSSAAVGDFDQVIECAKAARFIGVVGPSAGGCLTLLSGAASMRLRQPRSLIYPARAAPFWKAAEPRILSVAGANIL